MSISKPVFHAHVAARILGPEEVALSLETEGEERLLTGSACGLVSQLIDGRHTVDQIVEKLRNRVRPELIYFSLQRLEAGGYLTDADSNIPPAQSSFWRSIGVSPSVADDSLRNSTISVRTLGATDAGELREALLRLSVQIAEHSPFLVVLTDDYLHPDLERVNTEALASERPWVISKPIGQTPWLGPIFRPGVTGCWYCLAYRLRTNRSASLSRGSEGDVDLSRPSRAALPTTASTAINLLATQIAMWLVSGGGVLVGRIWTIDSSLETARHVLARRPQCAACGNPNLASLQGKPLTLSRRNKSRSVVGGHREVSAEQTAGNLERHVSPITGIIPVILKAEPKFNTPLHVYIALGNLSVTTDQNGMQRSVRRHGTAGKGFTEAEAKAACLAEAVERYSSCFHGEELCVQARYADFSAKAVSPKVLLQFSERQYRDRESWNLAHDSFQWIPEPFEEGANLGWTPAWSLTNHQVKYVPSAYCYMGYSLKDSRFFAADSNGCATGNSLEEAILHGLLEVVERDSVALWWYNRVKRPEADLESFRDPLLIATRENLRTKGRTLHVLDITSDFTIPAFVAVSWEGGGRRILFGSGADLDPRTAVTRAICEVNQLLETVLEREALADGPQMRELSSWLLCQTIDDHPYLVPSRRPRKLASHYAKLSDDDISQDIRVCVDIMQRHGKEVIVLDMTRPDIGFPAVKVIIPGLCHFWARFGLRRLYDVPVKLGWLTQPLLEEQLNPIPYML